METATATDIVYNPDEIKKEPDADPDADPYTGPSVPEEPGSAGGRRHKGSKKAHKGKRHGNASLRAWVTFVKKVQKEEGIGYKEAMSVAKKRKDGGEKWRGGSLDGTDDEKMAGGRRRRRTHKRRGSKRHSRRSHRRSRRH